MVITVYRVRIWTEGVWSGKRKGTTSTLAVRPFRTREACQEYIYKILPRFTQRSHLEPTWINWEIIAKKQYIPQRKKAE